MNTLVKLVMLVGLLGCLTACGQKGPLRRPEQVSLAPAHHSIAKLDHEPIHLLSSR
ncbi:MAG: hypothetical protein RLZZ385_2609 [Pseudomonadota bacterium]|jgi:predicted small lipoprotein YifL